MDPCAIVREARDKEKDLPPTNIMAETEEDKFRWLMHLQRMRIQAVGGRLPPPLEAEQP